MMYNNMIASPLAVASSRGGVGRDRLPGAYAQPLYIASAEGTH